MGQSNDAPKRCAIYTRKSSEEGLEQNFNSLHAQRQACESFVKSQAGEGWRLVKTAYNDGGFSGATMERPALKALLAHVREKRIDVVVVYKVDRLTRSLADFAKIVEIFDAHGVSFVAVTQQFNTTTSMGRLTLNVLLSFAQFEREVTGERIRDKIAASKQKGMWMGGTVPLGYDVRDRRLVVNAKEAVTVRLIFKLYTELKSVRRVRDELDRRSIVSKKRVSKAGARSGGVRSSAFYCGEVHDQGAGTGLPRLENIPAQSRRRHRIHRPVCRADDLVQTALCPGDSSSRPKAAGYRQRDHQPDRRVDRRSGGHIERLIEAIRRESLAPAPAENSQLMARSGHLEFRRVAA